MTELIVALDTDPRSALKLINETEDLVNIYKIGTTLVYSGDLGLTLIEILQYRGKQIFLDTKLYDIPETVKRTVENICSLGVDFITLHSGTDMIQAAVEGKGENPLKILTVPLLTSIEDSYKHITIGRIKHALVNGCDGAVISGDHLPLIKLNITKPCITVVPGIRSTGIPKDDQKRTTTPKEAATLGADYIIVGRQILTAPDKRKMVQEILNEMRDYQHV